MIFHTIFCKYVDCTCSFTPNATPLAGVANPMPGATPRASRAPPRPTRAPPAPPAPAPPRLRSARLRWTPEPGVPPRVPIAASAVASRRASYAIESVSERDHRDRPVHRLLRIYLSTPTWSSLRRRRRVLTRPDSCRVTGRAHSHAILGIASTLRRRFVAGVSRLPENNRRNTDPTPSRYTYV